MSEQDEALLGVEQHPEEDVSSDIKASFHAGQKPNAITLTPEFADGLIRYLAASLDQVSGGGLSLLLSLQNARKELSDVQ
jgi:hypothetical protein